MTAGSLRPARTAALGHLLRFRAPAPMVALGHGMIAVALFLADGHMHGPGLFLVLCTVGAWGLALHGAAQGREPDLRSGAQVAWAGAIVSALLAFVRPPGIYLEQGLAPFEAMAVATLFVLATFARDVFGEGAWPRAFLVGRRALLFALAAAIGAWLLQASPNPAIDVFPLHQQAAQAMLEGKSIYAEGTLHALETHRHTGMIGQYTYLPLGACLSTLAYVVTHDVRWADLVSQLLGAALLWVAARRCSGPRDQAWPDLLAALLLFHPRGPFVLEQAWTEPLALPFLGGFVVAILAGRPLLASVLLGLLCATKQHLLLYVPFLAFLPGVGVRGVIIAGATALATIAPFALRDPHDFYWAVFGRHAGGPFRDDALSVTAALWKVGFHTPAWVGFALGLAPAAALSRLPRRVAPLLLAACLGFGLFYVFGRQAFCNYYYLLDASALFVAATLGAEARAARA